MQIISNAISHFSRNSGFLRWILLVTHWQSASAELLEHFSPRVGSGNSDDLAHIYLIWVGNAGVGSLNCCDGCASCRGNWRKSVTGLYSVLCSWTGKRKILVWVERFLNLLHTKYLHIYNAFKIRTQVVFCSIFLGWWWHGIYHLYTCSACTDQTIVAELR